MATNLGRAIRLVRLSQNMRQCDLAEKTGLSVPYICLIEQDKRDAKFSAIEKICESLGIPTFVLLLMASQVNPLEFNQRSLMSLAKTILDNLGEQADATQLLNHTITK